MGHVVSFKKQENEKAVEQIVALGELNDAELVRLMLETLDEVHKRAPLLHGHSQHDYQGRLWSITAIMRAANRKVDNIRHVVGMGFVR